MLSHVKFCINHCNNYSFFSFKYDKAKLPVLVSLFLEDLEMFLTDNINSDIEIDDILLTILLFAGDMAIFGNSPDDLHSKPNLLFEYCTTRDLKENSEKN